MPKRHVPGARHSQRKETKPMSLTAILLGLINIAIVVGVLMLIGAIILWFCSWMGLAVPANVQKGYIVVVALIGLYMLVALLLGIPTLRLISHAALLAGAS
jgi:sterol desaturase/sphingolipid hydroxylase (fatty acid hydroxylase superfamily)